MTLREQYKDSTFKVALFDRWLVVVSGRTLVEELRRLPDDQVSFEKGAEEVRLIVITMPPLEITLSSSL